jgi:sirohydrochlorin ferrochelatase
MPETATSGFSALGNDARIALSDLSEMLDLRRQLAEAEIRHDLTVTKRLAIVGGMGAMAAFIGLPILLVALSLQLEAHFQLDHHGWTVGLGSLLLFAGLITLLTAYRRFRRDFVGLEESIAEFKEDLVWLREWVESQNADDTSAHE